MKNLKEEMLRVHRNSERIVIFAGVTKPNEFEYTHGGRVKPNVEYHIHYTVNKNEVYMTGATHTASSKIIKKINGDKTMYKKYTELVRQPRELYPRKNNPYPSDSDYRSKVIQRYFTQKVNNLNGELFEISKDDFDNQSILFRYIKIDWRISGEKSEVIRDNSRMIEFYSRIRGNEQLSDILFPLQFWKPPKDSPEELQEKLDRLKII